MNVVAGSRPVDVTSKSATAGRLTSLFTPFLESDWERYQQMVIRSLVGVYTPARIVAPLMVERKYGNLIAVSSTVARMTGTGTGALAAGKASVEALMRVVASELGPYGIRVNVVAPGAIETEASAPVIEARKEMLSKTLPLRRIGQPEDVAGAILLLPTDEAKYLTGNYLAVGGGNYMPRLPRMTVRTIRFSRRDGTEEPFLRKADRLAKVRRKESRFRKNTSGDCCEDKEAILIVWHFRPSASRFPRNQSPRRLPGWEKRWPLRRFSRIRES
jgi:hypothetical protein